MKYYLIKNIQRNVMLILLNKSEKTVVMCWAYR